MSATQQQTRPSTITKGVMLQEQADSPCKKIYFVTQLMFISEQPQELYGLFFELVRDVQKAAPSTSGFLGKAGECIMNDDYLGALHHITNLIEYEQTIIAKN
jgi:flagellar protein FlbT